MVATQFAINCSESKAAIFFKQSGEKKVAGDVEQMLQYERWFILLSQL